MALLGFGATTFMVRQGLQRNIYFHLGGKFMPITGDLNISIGQPAMD
jgi:hypothetical protein